MHVNADPLFTIGLSCGAYVATLFNPSTPFNEARFHAKGSVEFLKCTRARSIFHGLLCVKIADLLISSLLTPQELITAKNTPNQFLIFN